MRRQRKATMKTILIIIAFAVVVECISIALWHAFVTNNTDDQ
jgi:hypothetical protein